jgi:hypothetical protein
MWVKKKKSSIPDLNGDCFLSTKSTPYGDFQNPKSISNGDFFW